MRKLSLVFMAILAMVQLNAATTDVATSDATTATVSTDDDNENDFTYQHPLKDDDESTKHWSLTTNGFYLGMGVKHSLNAINNSFEIIKGKSLFTSCMNKCLCLFCSVFIIVISF